MTEKCRAEGERREDELRCCCGSLLARHTSAGIELRCRRCRRNLLLTVQADGSVSLVER